MSFLIGIGVGLAALGLASFCFIWFIWLPVMNEAREAAEFEARETGRQR